MRDEKRIDCRSDVGAKHHRQRIEVKPMQRLSSVIMIRDAVRAGSPEKRNVS